MSAVEIAIGVAGGIVIGVPTLFALRKIFRRVVRFAQRAESRLFWAKYNRDVAKRRRDEGRGEHD